jgi:hypothetical protein
MRRLLERAIDEFIERAGDEGRIKVLRKKRLAKAAGRRKLSLH